MYITIDILDNDGNKTGERNATISELKKRAQRSDDTGKLAVRDLIDLADGFDSLTDVQRKKVIKWKITGSWTDL